MVRLNMGSILVLIASTLLLSAASNGVVESPDQRSQSGAATQNSNTASTPVPVSEGKVGENTPANSKNGETYNYYGDFNYRSKDSTGVPWREIGEVATVFSTVAMALFTFALWRTSKRQWSTLEEQADILKQQVTLTQAQFDQWIELTNWRPVGQPRDSKLRIRVDLVNPTGFPMKFTGNLTVAGDERPFNNEPLFPNTNSPKSIDFEISIVGNEYGAVHPQVSARFTHPHKITETPVTEDWDGILNCEWWGREHKWNVTFTRFAARTER